MAGAFVMLRLMQNRTMNRADVQGWLERSRRDLNDARCSELSLPRRFSCGYDAARNASLAFCGDTNRDITLGERPDRDTFEHVIKALELDSEVAAAADRMGNCYRLESRLFYQGTTAIDETTVAQATDCARRI